MNKLMVIGQALLEQFLGVPGGKVTGEVTPTGKQVIKASAPNKKISLVRYPRTGTIVKTEVYREDEE